MAEIDPLIETNTLHFLQSWMHRDAAAIRKLASREFMMMIGTEPPELLDRPSFAAAIQRGFRCNGFKLGQSYVRRHGRCAWYVAGANLDLELERQQWAGRFLVTGLWRKFRFGGWKAVECGIAPLDSDTALTERVRQLQLWHR